jgi:probable F420-dependent oxidoreductase
MANSKIQFDATLRASTLRDVPEIARRMEDIGFGCVWTTETQHDPFLPLALAAEHTQTLKIGTGVAIAFARSPMTLAYTAWDLQAQSNGRLMLGLGTQVKPHIERRFGMSWPDSPVNKLREMIGAMRAIWDNWQTGKPLRVTGEYYKLTLMTPFFNPGAIAHPHIPIYIAGVNTGLANLCGEMCDGFHVHPFHTASYLREVLRPAVAHGAQKNNRDAEAIEFVTSVFVARNDMERAFAKQQISFYASTPSYRPVFEHHGWQDIGEQLSKMAAAGQWQDMPNLISDEILSHFAVIAPTSEVADAIKARYDGLINRVMLYLPFEKSSDMDEWRTLARSFA